MVTKQAIGPSRVVATIPYAIRIDNRMTSQQLDDMNLAMASANFFRHSTRDLDVVDAKSIDLDGAIRDAMDVSSDLYRTLNVARRKLDFTQISQDLEIKVPIEQRVYENPFYALIYATVNNSRVILRVGDELSEYGKNDVVKVVYFFGDDVIQFDDDNKGLGRRIILDGYGGLDKASVKTLRLYNRILGGGDELLSSKKKLLVFFKNVYSTDCMT
jgi:hypothetical protein